MIIQTKPADIHEKLRQVSAFTDLYRSFGERTAGAREAACMTLQFSYILTPMEPGDLLAGRFAALPIGFMPQPILEYGQGVGYYCDDEALIRWCQSGDLSENEIALAQELLDFWRTNTSKAHTEQSYSDDQFTYMTHGDYHKLPGVAFPLYRIGGTQLHLSRLVGEGLAGLRTVCRENPARNPDFFGGADRALAMLEDICLAYAELAEKREQSCENPLETEDLRQLKESLRRLAAGAPETLRDALQLVHLYTLVSGSFNYGRMDEYLTPFYMRDLAAGRLTKEEAKRLLKDLWRCMRVRNLTMDARVILGGKGRVSDAPQQADEFALAAMEVSLEVREPLPQLSLMCYRGMNPALWEKAMDLIGEGTTYPILYNDDVNIPSVQKSFGIPEKLAKNYIPFGCGEYVLYHKSLGTPSGAVNLLSLLNHSMDEGFRKNSYPFQKKGISALDYYGNFEDFYAYYLKEAEFVVSLLARQQKQEYDACGAQASYLLFSVLYEDCMERALPLLNGGIRHFGGTLETYGNTNTADSLTAIKLLVYEKKAVQPQTLLNALKANFEGYGELRRLLLDAPKYGNDDERADSVAARLHEDICAIVRSQAKKVELDSYLVVVINNRMNTVFGLNTGASADGRAANTYMANGNNPVGGMDRNGLTAVLNSLVKLRTDLHAGAVQNMRFSKEMFGTLRPKTEAILRAYFENGGSQAMISVLGRGDLEKAVEDPEAYRNLIVRVGGFSARFVELAPSVQQELISRTLY